MTKKEKIVTYLNAVYQNTRTAIQSIEDILPRIQSKKLKDEITKQQEAYYILARQCELFAKDQKIDEIKDNTWLEKAKLWTSIKMSTMWDKSSRKIAELMLLGTFMGIITCYKDQGDHKNISKEIDEIIEKLKELERNNIKRLLPYLLEQNKK